MNVLKDRRAQRAFTSRFVSLDSDEFELIDESADPVNVLAQAEEERPLHQAVPCFSCMRITACIRKQAVTYMEVLVCSDHKV